MPMIATPRIQWNDLEMVPQLDVVLPVIPACPFFAAILIAAPHCQGDLNRSKSLQVTASASWGLPVSRRLAENN
jgi:hypothetical protein